MNEFQIVKFESKNIEIDVNFSIEENTVWLTQNDISKLFNKDQSVISRNIKNILDNSIQDYGKNAELMQKMHMYMEALKGIENTKQVTIIWM